MRPSVLGLFLLVSELTTVHGGLVELYRMVTEVTGKKALPHYSSYGCYCGLGGKGTPKDATDRCCWTHDCCYGWLKDSGCSPKTTPYSHSYRRGKIQCGRGSGWCKWQICSCDRALAQCLKRDISGYKKSLALYPNFLCRGPSPAC